MVARRFACLCKTVCILLFCGGFFTGCANTPVGEMGASDTAESQYSLGISYLLGQGVRQSDKDAVSAFQRAASYGNPYAEAQLGFMYAAGRGVTRNYATAVHWYELAASQGVASAQYNLGLMTLHGVGTTANAERANVLFQDAADHDFEPARKMLTK